MPFRMAAPVSMLPRHCPGSGGVGTQGRSGGAPGSEPHPLPTPSWLLCLTMLGGACLQSPWGPLDEVIVRSCPLQTAAVIRSLHGCLGVCEVWGQVKQGQPADQHGGRTGSLWVLRPSPPEPDGWRELNPQPDRWRDLSPLTRWMERPKPLNQADGKTSAPKA